MKPSRRTEPQALTFPAAHARIGQDLKIMFDTLTAGPMPDRLIRLAMALEDALERGELKSDVNPRLN